MDFKVSLKIWFIGSISILVFLAISILAKVIGIEKEFFITLCLLGIIGIIYGIIAFTWGVARRQGIEYIWYLIFTIILYYGLIVCIFQIIELLYLKMPWHISLLIAISPLALMTISFFIYKTTADDDVKGKILIFLISLFAGQTIAIQIEKPIAMEIAGNSPKIVSIIDDVSGRTPILARGISYLKVNFPRLAYTTTEIGKKGEYITNRLITSQGYEKILSKIKGNQGIDHLFAKYGKNGELKKVQIVETKVNASQLRPDQMTDKGILERIDKLLTKPEISQKERDVYNFIKRNIGNNKVVKQLYNHNNITNKTTITRLGVNQELIK